MNYMCYSVHIHYNSCSFESWIHVLNYFIYILRIYRKNILHMLAYNESGSFGKFLTLFELMQTKLRSHVIIRCLVTDAPSHIHHLKLVAPAEAVLFNFRVGFGHPAVSFIFCIYVKCREELKKKHFTTNIRRSISTKLSCYEKVIHV